ncbi:MAG: hypothetical protein A2Z18_09305 [Armatimonadetes bacterium RBG_16_58_9]|nr:MAG: hypothetical protein A2Z18_09305 [Armatimonadetes bacterium RBG_16_58_9]
MRRNIGFAALLGLIAVAGLSGSAWALVDLHWRPRQTSAIVGDKVVIGLYAVSDSPADQLLSAMDVIVRWDPAFLGDPTLGEAKPYWLTDGFFINAPGEINKDLSDGNAMYTAWASFGKPVAATPEGLLCVEFEFTALAPVDPTFVYIDTVFGAYAETKVFDGTIPNHDIKGTLGSVQVTVQAVPEPASVLAVALGIACAGIRRKRGA